MEALGGRLGCPVTVERVTVARGAGRSPEDAARVARHAALDRIARRIGAARIALAHTADDQAETVLMRLLQGAGPHGLAGIPVRRGRLVRPLLEVDRAAVLAHLRAHGLDWIEDATNRDVALHRNRIRHEILPALATQVGPGLGAALRRTARASREAVEALEALLEPRAAACVRPGPGGLWLDLAQLRDLPAGAAKVVLRLALGRAGPGSGGRLRGPHLDGLHALLAAAPGARLRLPGGVMVERARDALWVGRRGEAPAPPTPIPVPGEAVMPVSGLRLSATLEPLAAGQPVDPVALDSPWEVWLDAAACVPGRLAIRPRRPGDRMVPFGSPRAVRVSRLLAEAGAPRLARDTWPLVVAGPDDEVLWVVGVRRGAAAPITAATTRVLRLRAVYQSGAPLEDSSPR